MNENRPLSDYSDPEKRQLLKELLAAKANASAQSGAGTLQEMETSCPLTSGQRSMWFLHRMNPDQWAYHIAFPAKIGSDSLNISALHTAVKQLAARHPALRSRVSEERMEMVIPGRSTAALETIEASGWSESELREEAIRHFRKPFSLTEGPLFRVLLFNRRQDPLLLIVVHHIVSDYWSLAVMVDDLGRLYAAAANQAPYPSARPAAASSFANYARTQSVYLESAEGQRHREEWLADLKEPLPILDLAADHTRPTDPTSNGASVPFDLADDLTERIRKLAQEEKVTPYVVLFAAYRAFLYRYTSQNDVVIGTPSHGRTSPGYESVVGYFANPLPVRSQVREDITFRELIQELSVTIRRTMARQSYPFAKLVEELHPERNTGRSPVFQASFALQRAPVLEDQGFSRFLFGDPNARLNAGGLILHPYPLPQQEGQFELSLMMIMDGIRIKGLFQYNTDLFAGPTIRRMTANFQTLLRDAALHADTSIGDLSLLGEEELSLLRTWNRPSTKGEQPESVLRRIERQSAGNPNATAIRCGEQTLTYSELLDQVRRLANALLRSGASRQSAVGVMLTRSARQIVAMLAVWEADCIYVPLDPEYPEERLRYMVDDSGVALLITESSNDGRVLAAHCPRLMYDSFFDSSNRIERGNLTAAQHSDDPAYIIYTSGTTGLPKGVVVHHTALSTHIEAANARFGIDTNDIVLQFSTFNFDTSIEQTLVALTSGAELYVRGAVLWSPDDLLSIIRSAGITVANLPTAYWQQMVLAWEEEQSSVQLSSLRVMIVGGEAMLPSYARRWHQLPISKTLLLNAYGPTETVITSHTFAVHAHSVSTMSDKPVPIGSPIGDRPSYVLDSQGLPVPVGVPGELYIGGTAIARGYWNKDELTEQKFVCLTLPDERIELLYRTGDIVRYLPDGMLEYVGRADHQLKIRGFRVEPSEIQSALLKHPLIKTAAVVAADAGDGSKKLAAYFVAEGDRGLSDQLRRYLAEQLPAHMIPHAFVHMERIPLTANGKVDRASLPAPRFESDSTQYAPPSNETEQILHDIWSGLLNAPSIGIHDNFFELGGDSIIGLQMAMRARKQGIALKPHQLFKHQTLAELARVVKREARSKARPVTEQDAVEGQVPLTAIQSWFFEQRSTKPGHYNQSFRLQAKKRLSPDLMKQAVEILVLHHDALRLRFHQDNGNWRQFNEPASEAAKSAAFEYIDLSSVGPSEHSLEETVNQRCAIAQSTLDLRSGPIMRALMFDSGPGKPSRLCLAIHHLAVDGVSWRIVLEDLESIYESLESGEEVYLPEKTSSFREWAQQVVEYAESDALRLEADYWTSMIDSAEPIPFDHELGPNTMASFDAVALMLTEQETKQLLQQAPKRYQAQINDLLLSALAYALGRWSSAASVLVALEGHGREPLPLEAELDVSRTVGWFTTVFPFPLRLFAPGADHPSDFESATADIRNRLQAMPHHGAGFGLLKYIARSEPIRALAEPQISFNYLGRFDSGEEERLLRIHGGFDPAMYDPNTVRSHPLSIDGLVLDGKLSIYFGYSVHLHRRETIEQLASMFRDGIRILLEGCAVMDGRSVKPDFLDQAEFDRLAVRYPQLQELYPLSPMQSGMLFHSLSSSEPDIYVSQFSFRIDGELDPDLYRKVWEIQAARHPMFRTAFIWDGVKVMCQAVHSSVELMWSYLDWRDQPEEIRESRWNDLMFEDRHTPFSLELAPLMRFYLARTGERTYRFSFTQHHLTMDGWSLFLCLSETFRRYDLLASGNKWDAQNEPSVRPYRHYIDWVQNQPLAEAEAHWKNKLRGFQQPTLLRDSTVRTDSASVNEWRDRSIQLTPEESGLLGDMSRKYRLTVNTLFLGTWALVLHHLGCGDDISFGTTSSGRPDDLDGIDSVVGLFINTLPARTQIHGEQTIRNWLLALQESQAENRIYDYVPLNEIQGWSELPPMTPMFNNIVVFENYPVEHAEALVPALKLTEGKSTVRSSYPLVFEVRPDPYWVLELEYDAGHYRDAWIEETLATVRHALLWLAAHLESPIRDALQAMEEEELRKREIRRNQASVDKYKLLMSIVEPR